MGHLYVSFYLCTPSFSLELKTSRLRSLIGFLFNITTSDAFPKITLFSFVYFLTFYKINTTTYIILSLASFDQY